MKYTIHGFSQDVALKLGLDSDGLLLLRWFVDFQGTGEMTTILIDGKPYYWVSYNKVIKDMPIISDKEDTIYRKFRKLCNSNVLKIHTVREKLRNGKFKTYAHYSFGENYKSLISSAPIEPLCKDSDEQSEIYSEKTEKNPSEYSEKNPSEYSEKNPYKIDLLTSTYSSIKKTHTENTSNYQLKDLCVEIQNILGEKISQKKVQELINDSSIDTVKQYMNNWDKYRPHVKKTQSSYFIYCIQHQMPVPTPQATTYQNGAVPQYANFDQRDYSELDLNKFYANMNDD